MVRAKWLASLVVTTLLGAAQSLRAAGGPPGTTSYAVGTIPVAAGGADFEFPLSEDFKAQLTAVFVSQGTWDSGNPFSYLSLISPSAWIHYDGIPNLRLSAGFEENRYRPIAPMGVPAWHEERLMARARVQQPRGASAIYEILQLDVRSFDDVTGAHRWVLRPRFRIGSGFNLDATRIHTVVLFQEVALRFAEEAYTTHAFDFYRAVLGYNWTTRRGIFVTAGVIGQVSLNPAGTRLDFLYGPVLSLAYRIFPAKKAPEEVPPEPPDVDMP